MHLEEIAFWVDELPFSTPLVDKQLTDMVKATTVRQIDFMRQFLGRRS
jgi:hypothetical protein